MKKYKKVYIEITNICNLKCTFCPVTKRQPEFMSTALFSQILDEIRPFTEYINLHVKGEPLLHPNLGDLLDKAFEKGFKVNITTNGTLIDAVADILLKKPAVRQISFSLHSFDANQSQVSKDEYINNILDFSSRAIAESNIIIVLRLWNLDEALLTEDQRRRNLDIIYKMEQHFRLPFTIQSNLSLNKAIKLAERVYFNQDYEFKWPDLKEEEDQGNGYCYGLKNQIAILVDGAVVPCCLDGEGVINLGNINQEKFANIVNGERAERIRIGFSNRKVVEELCRKCGFRLRFNKKQNIS